MERYQRYQDYEMFGKKIRIAEEDQKIVRIESGADDGKDALHHTCVRQETPLIRRAAQELEEYFRGERQSFDLPLAPAGTPFQQKVWEELRKIPYGQTASYGQIAVRAGSPRGARAVGLACNRNPILIMIPCHRVIGADGSLTGFGGGLDMKERLLDMEKKNEKTGE